MIELVDSGHPQPTVTEVADRAGTGRRTVFNQLGDADTLYCEAARWRAGQCGVLIGLVPPHGPTDARVRAICRQRAQLFEAIGPVMRAAALKTRDSQQLRAALADHHWLLRHQLTLALGPELAQRGTYREVLLDTIELASGWANWYAHRRSHTVAGSERIMVYTVGSLLD